jgi:hypothetical protein
MNPDLSHLSPTQRLMWNRYLAGEAVPFTELPTIDQQCEATTDGGAVCGWPLLIDGSCAWRCNHANPGDLDEPIVTDAMVCAFSLAYEGRPAGEAPIRDQRIRDALAAALRARED